MAASVTRHVWMIVILCVALLFVSGIILPKLFSKHYFKLRSELNAHNKSLIVDYGENLEPSDTKITGDQVNTINSNDFDQNLLVSERMQHDGASSATDTGTLQIQRTVKRNKREASNKDDNEYFAWNFNLNISRYKHPKSPVLVGNVKHNTVDYSEKGSLDAAIYLAGKGPSQTYNLQKGLDSVGAFIRNLFGGGVQNLTYEETEKNEDIYSLNGILRTDSDVKVIKSPVSVKNDESKGRTESDSREGRFLFDFLGFGRPSTAKTTQSIESKVTSENPHEPSNISMIDKNETDFNIGKDIFAHTGFQDVDFVDEGINFRTKASVSESEHSTIDSLSCGTKDECELLHNLNGVTEVTSQEFRNLISDKAECTDCDFDLILDKENETEIQDIFNTNIEFSAHQFTDEKLEDFCMNLVHKLGESGLPVYHSSEKDGKNKESDLSTPGKLKMSDCFNLLGDVEKPKTNLGIIEDSFLVSTDATDSSSDSAKDTGRDARILSWLSLGFGSGRAGLEGLISEEKLDEPTDEQNADTTEETENEPTIKDCISYFRKNQNIKRFPKPNLMDILSNSNIEITDFANATISPKLKEQQIQFVIDFLETTAINCALEKDGINTENMEIVLGEKSKFSPEKFSTKEEEPNTRKGETSTLALVTDLKWIDTQVASEDRIDEEIQQTTEIQKDERIFGFGSGDDASPEIDDLRFINSKNGEEKLQGTSTDESKYNFDAVTNVNVVPDFDLEATSNEGRFINLGFGSGDGRQLTENSDIHIESEETGCENDCFVENASVKTDDCNDNECYSEQPFEQNFSMEILQNNSSNENDCYDCSSFITNDSNATKIKGDISYNSKFNETSWDLKIFNESCTCHEHDKEMGFTPENTRNRECDDCSWSINEIQDKDFTNTEKNPFKIGFEDLTSTTRSRGNDCDDCDYQPETEIQNPESDPFKIEPTYADSRSFNDTVSEYNLESSEFQSIKDVDHTKAVEVVTELSNILEEFETEQNSPRFQRPVLLMGSGDGGFGDSGGRINLTEEGSNSHEELPARRGRLDDGFAVYKCDDCDIDLSNIQGKQDIPEETAKDIEASFTTENSDKILKHRIGRVEGKSNQTMFAAETTKESFQSEVFSKSILDFSGDILTTTEPPPRFCVSASECNIELNERCITSSTFSSICSCARAFVRNKVTEKCVKKSMYTTALKFPAEKFEGDFGNPESPRYKQRQSDANKMMHVILKDNAGLVPIIADVTFLGFRRGSLIMTWNIGFAAENESEAEIVSHLQKDLNRGLLDENLKEKVAFNVSNAYVLSVSNTLDPCISTELNYCHKNSHCIRNRALPGGFECRCKGDYIDVSFNPDYPGEICEAYCTSDFCGHHGECIWAPEMGRHCVCRDWYFGDRCGISGKVVVAGFSANVFVFIVLILVLVVCKARRKSRTYGRTQRRRGSDDFGGHAIAAGRVSDVIAMEENIGAKVGKISNISTPVQKSVPLIKVVRPTLNESSISIYDDSTFDVTPTSDLGQNNSEQETRAVDAPVF